MRPESSREVFRGIVVRVEEETWGGQPWETVRHPGACAVLPITLGGDVLLVRQFRMSVRRSTSEIPGIHRRGAHVFVARTTSSPETEPEGGIEIERVSLDEALAAVREGRLTDVNALALCLATAEEDAEAAH